MKEKEKVTFSSKKKDPSKYVNINPTLDASSVNEEANKSAAITFGRFNPPTAGHAKLIDKVLSVAKANRATPLVYTSHTQDSKKNPLSYNDKQKYMKIAFGDIVKNSPARTIIEVAKELSDSFDNLYVIVGSDRIKEFETLLNKYNGKEYNFNTINIISAGERDPDADDVSGMSASKMRFFVSIGDEENFTKGLPKGLKGKSKELFHTIQKEMKLMEEYSEIEEGIEEAAPLTLAQRRRRGMIMRRYKSRMKIARERARRRKATPEKLKMRAQRKALNLIRQRLMKQKSYAEMSPAEKIALDKRLARVPKTAIARIARKELPKVRQAEIQRLATLGKPKEESYNINELFEQFVNEPQEARKKKFRYLYTREGKVNFDGRYKMYRPKNHVIESLEDFEDDLFDLIESTEKFVKGLDKTKPSNREYGTDSLVKILKSDTPGEKMEEARMVPPIKHAKTTVPDFVEPSTPDIAALVSKHNKHHLGVGLSLKHMIKHALKNRDVDNDGDVDAEDMKAVGGGELVGDPSFDRTKTPGEATSKMKKKYEKEARHTKPGLAFEDYYAGLSKSTAAKRKAHFKKGASMDDDNPAAYKPAPGDARAKTKPSIYTKRFKAMYGEEVDLEESAEKSLKDKAEKTGISYGILKKVYDRGVAAWRTGHRPGTTPSQWGHARVNSFATGGKTRQTADADLWKQHSKKNEEFDIAMINESTSIEKILDVMKKHVLSGEKLMDIAWNISQLAAVDMSAHKLYNLYVNKYGNPEDKKMSNKFSANALRSKYGFKTEMKARGFEGKMVNVPNVPVRMADGKVKSFPAGKSSSSDGNGGNGE